MSRRAAPVSTPLDRPWLLDEPIPRVCFKEDVCRILRVSMRQLEVLLRDQKLPLVRLALTIDTRPRFTGQSVAACARGRWEGSNEPAQMGRHGAHRSEPASRAPREAMREFRGEASA